MNFVRFECQIHEHEPRFFAFDFRGSYTPVIAFEEMKRAPLPKLTGCKTVLDIGANVGMWSIRMAILHPEVQFIAYEPYSVNLRHLVMGVRINERKNIEIIDRAVTHDGSDITLVMDPIQSGSASQFNNMKSEMYPRERVKSVSLNSVALQYASIDALKVDIEGGEFMLFEGFEHWDKIKKLYIDVYPKYAGVTVAEQEYTIRKLLTQLRDNLGATNVFVDCTEAKYRTY